MMITASEMYRIYGEATHVILGVCTHTTNMTDRLLGVRIQKNRTSPSSEWSIEGLLSASFTRSDTFMNYDVADIEVFLSLGNIPNE